MKKILSLGLAILLGLTILVGCNKNETDQGGNQEVDIGSNLEPDTEEELLEDEEEEWISEDQARAILQSWLDEHPEMVTPYEPTTIGEVFDELYIYNEDYYYHFPLAGYYWLDILVHTVTGELLCIQLEEADESEELEERMIEPLDDYYENYYGSEES